MLNEELRLWRRRARLAIHIATLLAHGERVWLVQRDGQLSLLPEGPRIIGEEYPYAEGTGLDR